MHPVIPATLLAAAVCLVSDNLTSAGVPRRRDRWRFVSKRTAGDSGSQHLVEIVRKRLSRVPNGWISSLRNTNAFDCDLFLFNDSPGWPISTISLGTAPFYAVARSSSAVGNHRNKTGSRFLLRTKQDAIDPVSRSVIQRALRGRKCLSYFLLLDFANLEPMANDPKLEILWGADSKKFLLLRDSNSSADDLDENLGKPDFLRRHWKLKEPFQTYVVTVEEDGAVGRRYFELLWRCKFCSPRGEHEYRETHYQSGNRFEVPETFRGNFHGARLVLGTKEANPYVYVTGNDTDTGEVRFGGLVPGLVDLIGRKMNFSYEYVFSPDNKFGEGARDEEGELGGLLGMVYRREVDFTATAIPMDGPEHAFMDFSYPFHIGKLRLYTNAALDPPKWLQLWHVYSWGVAALTCSTALFAGFVTYLSDRLVPELDANGHVREYEESRWLLVLRMLFKTGAPEGAFPRTFVKRLAFMVLLLFTSLSEKIFSAALPGQFAFPEHGKEVQNFEQLDRLGVQIARVETDEHAHLSHVLSRFVSRPLVVLPDGTDLPELIRRNPFMYATPTMTDPFVVDIEDRADLALIGLAVMGQNLILNMNDHGFTICAYNRTVEKVDRFLENEAKGTKIVGARSMKDMVAKLKKPRKVMLLVKAGSAVDDFIEQLIPLLDKGDVIIDGGNSDYHDSIRRSKYLEEKGLLFVGTGVSGGEEGARYGPSLMPGGNPKAWPLIRDIFQSISAKADGEPCCDWVGEDGAGHFVKMVHNGIEYGDMQLICEAYQLMRDGMGMGNDEMSEVLTEWNKGELDSFLIEITANILKYKDESGDYLVEKIRDTAGQKGTGKWTAISSLELGTPVTLIGESVFARCLSSLKDDRVQASKILEGPAPAFSGDKAEMVEHIRKALYASKIISYAQGFMLLREAAKEYNWKLNYGGIALMWRGGCIIRSVFLGNIKTAFDKNPELTNLLLDDFFKEAIHSCQDSWREVVAAAVKWGVPVPAFSAALSFYDGFRRDRLPANLIQAQRDYFGAHTYELLDAPGKFVHTNWTGKGGEVSSSAYNA